MKKALLIGINYKNTKSQLEGCINDINNFYTLLTNFFNYEPKNIVCLSEESGHLNFPTKRNIQDAIKWLLYEQQEGDTLTLYYSGHGSNIPDLNNDEKDGFDEVIIPLDFETQGVISDDWFNINLVEKVKKDVTLYSFFDCCNSGTVLDLKCNVECDSKPMLSPRDIKMIKEYDGDKWTNSFKITNNLDNNSLNNRYCFSACLNSEYANELNIETKKQGIFSYFLQELIRNDIAKNNKCTLTHKEIIKAINALLYINNFDHQNCMLSISNISDMDKILNL